MTVGSVGDCGKRLTKPNRDMLPSLLEQLAWKQKGSKAGVEPAGPIEAVAVGSRDVRGHDLSSRLDGQPADSVLP